MSFLACGSGEGSVDAETIGMLTLTAVDVALVGAAIFFGWRPFGSVLRKIGKHAFLFLGTFLGVLLLLTVLIPVIDTMLYVRGVVLPDDFMIYVAPTFMLIAALAASLYVVWRAESSKTPTS